MKCASASPLAIASACLLVGLIPVRKTSGQSSDALLDKLVNKGILTIEEAAELKKENQASASRHSQSQTSAGLPGWVDSLKFGGEFRGRYEGFHMDNPDAVDRHRFRYRLRFGAVATLKEDFEIGLRLMSGEPVNAGIGGDPNSGNTTLQDNGSKKLIYVDLAYARWTPIRSPEWSGAFTLGKMEIPLVVSDIVFDDEHTPEGFGAQFAWKASKGHTFKLNGGAFVLDELATDSADPYLFAAQARWDAVWGTQLSSSIGVTALGIVNEESLLNGNVHNGNRGNTRDASGAPVADFNPVNADASVTWTFPSMVGYVGSFPMKLGGEFMVNPAIDDKNIAYSVGLQFGKAVRKGTWEFSYRWKSIEADVWYEEVMDGDFGAYYPSQLPNSGSTTPGFAAGTNVRGHVIKAAYALYDSLTLQLNYFITELIDNPGPGTSEAGRLQCSALWKF